MNTQIKKWPHVTNDDIEALINVASDTDFKKQRYLQEKKLSEEWSRYLKVKYSLICSSGTAALHMALSAVGVENGDEVIVPAFSWWATAAAVLQQSAIPVFVDIEPEFYCIDPKKMENAITKKTKAIIVVHIHGMPADVDRINKIAKKYKISVIEDAAQAHGSEYKKKKCGTLGNVAAFSLETSKNLTTGSTGGILTTNSYKIFKNADNMRRFEKTGLGWGYRGDVFGQAFARSQLKRLDTYNRARRRNCNYLIKRLKDLKGIRILIPTKDRNTNFYNFVISFYPQEINLSCSPLELRIKIQKYLNKNGVPSGLWMHNILPEADKFDQKSIKEKYPVAKKFIDSSIYIWNPLSKWVKTNGILCKYFKKRNEQIWQQ